jgi:CBS-domain-containing membrane protein
MSRWAGGGIILSSMATRYQLGFDFHAAWVMAPLSASRPHDRRER